MKTTTKITKQDGEYRVRLFIGGIYQAGGDYFTDDKEDAEHTANRMKENPVPTDKTDENAIREQQEYDQTAKSKQRKIMLNSFECCVVVGVLNFLYENKLVWDISQDSPMNWHEMSKLFADDLTQHVETDNDKEFKLTVADALIVSDLLTEGSKSQLLKEYSQGKIIHWYNLASVVKEQIDNQIGR